jgi:hypothetical protein
MPEKIITYLGKNIEDMTREELIEALRFAEGEIQRLAKEKQRERSFALENFAYLPTAILCEAGEKPCHYGPFVRTPEGAAMCTQCREIIK